MMGGTVEGIFVAEQPGEPMRAVPEVVGEAGHGLVGDRHYRASVARKRRLTMDDLSLVEAEVLDSLRADHGIDLAPIETRRNIVVRGVRLNDLIGQRFRLGGMLCEGIEVCQPCAHMQKKVGKPVLKPLAHRGGLRARILEGGTVRLGDGVAALEAPARA
jgi:hypothetical protein